MRRRRTRTRRGPLLGEPASGTAATPSAHRVGVCLLGVCIAASWLPTLNARADQAGPAPSVATDATELPRALGDDRAQSVALTSSVAGYAGGAPRGATRFRPPRAPELAPPRLTIELHTGVVSPLENRGLCPADGGCVLQSGGGVGGTGEWRWPSGFGMLLGYDLSFFDTDAVFELGVQNALRTGLRFTAPTDIIFHPTFEVAGGGHLFGDTFQVATFGALVQVGAGAEVELSATYCMRASIGMRVLSHSRFRTARDGVLRGDDYPLAAQFYAELGLGFM
jgi:hypothetical protein